jgi:hypothetical protein
MKYIYIEDDKVKRDRINLENISGFGKHGDNMIKIYFNNGETVRYSYDNKKKRDEVLEEMDRKVDLIQLTPASHKPFS